MIEAVRTTASPGVIWAIVVVMSFFTAFLVAATQVADHVQSRQDRRRRMMLRASGAAGLPSQRTSQDVLTGPDGSQAPEPVPAGMSAARPERSDPANPVPAQRQDAARQAGYGARDSATQDAAEAPTEPIPASADAMTARRPGSVPEQGPVPEPAPMTAQGASADRASRTEQAPMARQGASAEQASRAEQAPRAEQGPVPEQGPRAEQGSRAEQGPVPQQGPMPETAGARGRHARGNAEATEDEAPAGGPGQAGDPGRHAMPAQRSGESDRAERSFAGPVNPDPDENDRD